jgi:ABC-type lipoprotein export system ATPase subunit/bifunctional DNA-binding transcriptional regulator/antitoxin component of YhaV-PrlF toxin-antitoxin module
MTNTPPETQKKHVVICENLVKIYKVAELEVVALQGLDLNIEYGEMLGIVGSSGSGKSTLLNILGGLDRPSAGRVSVDGMDLLKLNETTLTTYQREKVGFVWQQTGRNLIPYLTAQENIELPMTMAGKWTPLEKSAWAEELLEAVGLYDRRHHKLTQLSGGQQQRISIAVALANKPAILLGDEPTGEVDTATAQAIMDTFRRLREQFGLTIIIVTHDPRIAGQVDRVVAIRDGKTSTETIRQVGQLEHEMVGDRPDGLSTPLEHEHITYNEYVVLDSAGRLQVPREWLDELGIGKRAQLEFVEGGVMIRPAEGHVEGEVKRLSLEDQLNLLFTDEQPPAPLKPKGLFGRLKLGKRN